jgi:hypothetical protein
MKYGFSLLLICIVTVAGVAALLLSIDLVSPFRSSNAIVRQEPEPRPDARSQASTKQASKPARSRAVIDSAPTHGVSTGDPIAAGRRIPAATQNGTTAETYGEPALSIRRLDHGHDLETLVYARNRGKEITVVSLEDGKVSSHSPSGIAATIDSPGPRPDEHATALLARPTQPQPAAIAMPPAAEVPMTFPRVFDKTLAEVPTATKPADQPPVKGNVGTCGEYRDGKLTVKPCSQVPLSTSEWLAKGAGAEPAESAPAANQH